MGGSVLVIVVDGNEHNFDLDDEVSDFDQMLFERFPQFRVSVFTVPESRSNDLSVYADPDSETVIYARAESTPVEG